MQTQRWLHFTEAVEPLMQLYQDQPPTEATKHISGTSLTNPTHQTLTPPTPHPKP